MSLSNYDIIIASPNRVVGRKGAAELRESGFHSVQLASSINDTRAIYSQKKDVLCFIDGTWEGNYNKGLQLSQELNAENGGVFIILTEDPSVEQFYLGALYGIRDYLVKSPELHLGREAIRLMAEPNGACAGVGFENPIQALGFFRTLGLSRREMEILMEYMSDFPKHAVLSNRVGKSAPQLRKTFSAIYRKLSDTIAVTTAPQLAQLLTIAQFYRCSAAV